MCTSIVLKSDDQLVLHGRTMDFPFELAPDMVFIPRNHSLSLIYEKPLTAHYAFMGLGREVSPNHFLFADGINEHGLMAAALYFPGYAQYSREEKKK